MTVCTVLTPMKVVLDCHPFFTTLVVVVGWAIKTIVGRIIGGWVGDNGDAWLAYSIP